MKKSTEKFSIVAEFLKMVMDKFQGKDGEVVDMTGEYEELKKIEKQKELCEGCSYSESCGLPIVFEPNKPNCYKENVKKKCPKEKTTKKKVQK